MRFLLLLLGVSAAAAAQALTISSSEGATGSDVSVKIRLESPPGKAPVTLQMDVVFPVQLLDADAAHPEIGQAAKDSGKSIMCATHKPYSYTCLIFGGQKPIDNGSIATFRFKIHADARSGAAPLRIQNVQAVGQDFKQFALKDAEGTLTIR
jgi:hypothetical protein